MDNDAVLIRLERQHALVLCDFLARFTNEDRLEITDQAEQRALWDLFAILEGLLPEVVDNHWVSIVQSAKDSLRDSIIDP